MELPWTADAWNCALPSVGAKLSFVPGCIVGAAVTWPKAATAYSSVARKAKSALDIEIGHLQRIVLDEVAARLDHVAHQGREDLVGFVGMVDLDLQEHARLGIARGLPQLVRIHLAQALVALDRDALAAGLEHGGEQFGRRGDRRVLVLDREHARPLVDRLEVG